jgi:hypothetical protein
MPRQQRYDICSKWLLHNQGKRILQVGGVTGVQRLEPMPGEIAQSRKWPDALFKVYFQGERAAHYVLIEVATYSEKRALEQALTDLTQAYTALRELPELLMFVLRPKGTFRIRGTYEIRSKKGVSSLTGTWKPVEMWTLPAEDYLASGDVGIVPLIPLMRFDGPPEALLERCAEKIEREAHPKDKPDLLVVSQVLSQLKFSDPELLNLLKGKEAMIESPLLERMRAETIRDLTLADLKTRFGSVPRDITKRLTAIIDEEKQRQLHNVAVVCKDIAAFREALLA